MVRPATTSLGCCHAQRGGCRWENPPQGAIVPKGSVGCLPPLWPRGRGGGGRHGRGRRWSRRRLSGPSTIRADGTGGMWLGRATARGRDGRERGGTEGRGLVLPGDGPSRPSPRRLRGRRQRAASTRTSRGRGRPRGDAVPRRRIPLPSGRSAVRWRRFPSCDGERGGAGRQGRGGAERIVERASRSLTTRRGVLPRARRRVPRQPGVGVACKVPGRGRGRYAPMWDGVGQGWRYKSSSTSWCGRGQPWWPPAASGVAQAPDGSARVRVGLARPVSCRGAEVAASGGR